MPEADGHLLEAIAAIDAANAADPNLIDHGGHPRPKELVHAERATRWLLALDPGADAAQRVAVRAHHLRRWVEPRSAAPAGRAGYLRWRSAQKQRHAAEVAAILTEVGWDVAAIEDVERLVRKEGLGADIRVQVHEDALCLTFLELQLDELLDRLGAEQAVEVLARTARKMSPAALAAAGSLALSERGRAALERALEHR